MIALFLGFLKVGCFSFGGAYAAIPLIREVVTEHQWLTDEMLEYMIAVAESTPGPIMVNLATYVGVLQGGIPGALLATFAVVLPAFLIILLVTSLLTRLLKHGAVSAFIRGMMAAMAGIIAASGAWMIARNLFSIPFTVPDWRCIGLTALLSALYFGGPKFLKKPLSPIALIALSAVLGMVVYSI